MNKVFNINLGGYPFTIDDDAYDHLRSYLDTIHLHFRDSEGYEEITTDIESRMAELFQESLGDRPIINLKDVQKAISIMGTPEEFGAEPMEEAAEKKEKYKTGKRLFRNSEDEVLGGVCSGIAAYFGIADPIWIRIAFIVFTISGGFGIPLYIILWAVVPKATSSSDRLAMRGEPINIATIGKTIEEEFGNLSNKVSELGEELVGKKKAFSKAKRKGESGLRRGLGIIGQIIRAIITTLGKVWKPLLLLIGFALMIAFAVSWIGSILGIFFALPFLNYLSPDQPSYPVIAAINVLFLLGIPIASLILLITRILFGTRVHSGWKAGMIGFMILNAISLSFVATNTARNFNTGTTQSQGIDLSAFNSDTISLEAIPSPYQDTWFQIGDQLKFTEEQLIVEMVEIDIRKGEGDLFELIQENHSRGPNLEEAKELAIATQFQVEQEAPDQLRIPKTFQILKGQKWRNQQVKLILKVPVGKAVHIGNQISLHEVDLDNHRINPWREKGKIWRMEPTGLVCTNCDNKDHEQKFQFSDFHNLKIDGNLKVQINQGENFDVNVSGRSHYVDRIDFVKLDSTLNISAKLDGASSPVRLYITMPQLNDIQIENTDDLSIKGFKQPSMQINHKGRDEVKAYIDVDSLLLRQLDHSKLDLYGKCQHLEAHISNKSRLDAEKASLKTVNIQIFEASRAALPFLQKEELEYQKDESSTIKIEGKTI